jgi:predicted nucleic acid-binding protein
MLNLDTHILIDALAGRLRPREQALLIANRWSISAIVLWELAKLSQLGRIELDIQASELEMALSIVNTRLPPFPRLTPRRSLGWRGTARKRTLPRLATRPLGILFVGSFGEGRGG